MLVHRTHHLIGGVRASHGEYFRVSLFDNIALGAEAASDNHLAIFGQRLADGVERFLHRRIDKAAGVDHHQIGIVVRRRYQIAFRAQLRQDAFGIDQCLGAA